MGLVNAGVVRISGNGRRSTISMSNTRKITASRKNRRENGRRADFLGSKPHSNGEAFSRSLADRALSIRVIAIMTDLSVMARISIVSVRSMSFEMHGTSHQVKSLVLHMSFRRRYWREIILVFNVIRVIRSKPGAIPY